MEGNAGAEREIQKESGKTHGAGNKQKKTHQIEMSERLEEINELVDFP